MKDALTILRDVDALFADPAKWGKGYYALTVENEETGSLDSDANCFCLQGAIELTTDTPYYSDGHRNPDEDPAYDPFFEITQVTVALEAAITRLFAERVPSETDIDGIIPHFNDNLDTTIEDVRKVIADAQTCFTQAK